MPIHLSHRHLQFIRPQRFCPKSPIHPAPPCHSGVSVSIPSIARPCLATPTCLPRHIPPWFNVFILLALYFPHCVPPSETILLIYLFAGFFSMLTVQLWTINSVRAETSPASFSTASPILKLPWRVQYPQPRVCIELLKCAWSMLRCADCVKYTSMSKT